MRVSVGLLRLLLLAGCCALGWLLVRGLILGGARPLPVLAWKPEEAGPQEGGATLSLPQVTVMPGVQVTVPLSLALAQGEVYSADIVVTCDPAVATAARVERGSLVAGWSLASNLATPGVVRVALAGAIPITTSGELLLIIFDVVGQAGSETDLTLARGDLNEGGIPVILQHGRLSVALPTPTPTDTPTATPTNTPTATPTNTSTPTPTNTPTPTPVLSTIEGRVCQDTSRDGQCQDAEPGIAGLRVTLDPAAGQNLQPQTERTTITDAEGRYRFSGVEPGSHRLRFEDPTRQWLVAPVEVDVDSALHQTVTMDLGVSGPAVRLYLPLVLRNSPLGRAAPALGWEE
ncbi:MAG: SdrD B-like domain-containing protein [Anaerolineae bacterium]